MRWLRAGRTDRGRGGRGADRARSHVSRLWSASGPLRPRENPARAVGEHRGRPSRGGLGSRRGGMGGARGRDVRGGRAARATRAPSRPRGGPSSQAGRDGQRRAGERRQVGAARMLRAGRGPESWTLRTARALSSRFRSPCRVPSWSGDARARTSPAPPAKVALGSQPRPLRVLGPGSRDLALSSRAPPPRSVGWTSGNGLWLGGGCVWRPRLVPVINIDWSAAARRAGYIWWGPQPEAVGSTCAAGGPLPHLPPPSRRRPKHSPTHTCPRATAFILDSGH